MESEKHNLEKCPRCGSTKIKRDSFRSIVECAECGLKGYFSTGWQT